MTSQSAPAAFPLFSQLPTELRLKIWELAVPPPRHVHLHYKPTYRWQLVSSWISSDPIPTILHVCRDSREIGLKYYQVAFGTWVASGRAYFDYSRDTLILGNENETVPVDQIAYLLDIFLSADFGVDDSDRIRKLQFSGPDELLDRTTGCWDDVRLLPGLEELTLECWTLQSSGFVVDSVRTSLRKVARSHPDWKIPHVWMRYKGLQSSLLWEYPNPEDEEVINRSRESD